MPTPAADGVPWARFDDVPAGTAQAFPPPGEVLVAQTADEVAGVLEQVDRATRQGAWAVGCVAYEAAAAFDLPVRDRRPDDGPLAWFGLCGAPRPVPPLVASGRGTGQAWRRDGTDEGYRADVERVRAHIAAGEVYQCNLTVRLRGQVEGDLAGLYADLVLNQRTAYGAYLDTGAQVVLSASPELFFEWRGDRLTTRPMKGTAPRGRTPAEDRERLLALTRSEKERAENVMVVDLLRNDVGRVAVVGTVDVPALCVPERYETVWQLTSDVTGTLRPGTGLLDVFRALFPSGSVTGAPKHRAMRVVRDLETSPRGIYCGAVGVVAPPSEAVRARFAVGIRTVTVDRASGAAVYGTGGGITWGSDPDAELAEVRAKAAVLRPRREYDLLETMAHVPGHGVRHLTRHLRRLAASADHLGFACDPTAVRQRVLDAVRDAPASRVRLVLRRSGALAVELGPLPPAPTGPVVLAVDPEPVDPSQTGLFHKTSDRRTYTDRAARHPLADDVVLVNDRGEVTESTVANLALLLDGRWYTPPVSCGLLPGVERGRLVERGVLAERAVTVADLRRADALALVSSLRGWRAARLAP